MKINVVSKTGKKYALILSITVLFNIYGQYLQGVTGISSFAYSVVPLAIIYVMSLPREHKVRLSWTCFVALCLCCFVCIFQLALFGYNISMIKNAMYVLMCIAVSQRGCKLSWEYFRKLIVLISIVMSVDAILQIPQLISVGDNLHNVRQYTMLDKPMYSLILTMACAFIFVDMAYHRNKNQIGGIILSVCFVLVNLFIIQSKSSILCLIIGIAILLFSAPPKMRKRIFLVMLVLVIFGGGYLILHPDSIPTYIKVMLYQYMGLFQDSSIDFSKYGLTYSTRNNIISFAFELFKNNPVFGIGFGNYSLYGSSSIGISETESSLINSFVEGGTIYGLSHVILCAYLVFRMAVTTKKGGYQASDVKMLVMLVLYIIFAAQNDFMSLTYWIFLGLVISRTHSNNRWVNIDAM